MKRRDLVHTELGKGEGSRPCRYSLGSGLGFRVARRQSHVSLPETFRRSTTRRGRVPSRLSKDCPSRDRSRSPHAETRLSDVADYRAHPRLGPRAVGKLLGRLTFPSSFSLSKFPPRDPCVSCACTPLSTARSRAAPHLASPRGESASIVAYSRAEHTRDERNFLIHLDSGRGDLPALIREF
jgi:hypothetical protein